MSEDKPTWQVLTSHTDGHGGVEQMVLIAPEVARAYEAVEAAARFAVAAWEDGNAQRAIFNNLQRTLAELDAARKEVTT